MNGAKADPCVKIINPPSRTSIIKIGASHHFLRTLRNCQSSLTIDNLLIGNFLLHYF